MWIRKTPSRLKMELNSDSEKEFRLRISPLRPLLVVFGAAGLYGLGRLAGITTRNNGGWINPVPLTDWLPTIFQALPAFIISALIGSALVYVYQLVYGPILSEKRGDVLLCTRCFEARNKQAGTVCICGGTCEPIEDWNWVDDAAVVDDAGAIKSG
jgi:hypothetical protein